MLWLKRWPETLLAILLVSLEFSLWSPTSTPTVVEAHWTDRRKLDAREKTRDLWYHGFNSYMRYGRGPDWNDPSNIAFNDVAGNFSVTLIDVLDSLVVLNDRPGFEKAVRNVIDWVSFDVNTKPQVFETNIRVLGGLLSGHIFANKTGQLFHLPWYRGELLSMAHDLGKRLLPAFSTPTGIPLARLNLRHGVQRGESVETCTAGAGSLILEFATLSRLTGDDRFEKAAYKAYFALWNRKSDIGLVGNTINTWLGTWNHPEVTSIGAGVDSFYEYALKWYIMSGEVEFLDVWHEAYAAIMRYARAADGFWVRSFRSLLGDSLSAFWPGLQVLAGDVENAVKSHLIYWNLWKRHSGMPEVFDINFSRATSFQYPLRPEFVESTWYLYRATRDPFYLDVGERILYDIIARAKVECGLTSIQDLRTNQRDDRMESFVLSETLKYLFLLFDEKNPFNSDDSNAVFTTEGHILTLETHQVRPISEARRKLRRSETLLCPAYHQPIIAYDHVERDSGLIGGIRSRVDMDYARELTGTLATEQDTRQWSPDGWCELPNLDLYSFDFILSPDGQTVPEDVSPGPRKMVLVPGGYLVHNVTGIRAHVVRRLDGKGYDITKLGPHIVRSGQIVRFDDPSLLLLPVDKANNPIQKPDVKLRFFMDSIDPMFRANPGMHDVPSEVTLTAYTASFGGDLTERSGGGGSYIRFGHGGGVPLVRVPANRYGCDFYEESFAGDAIFALRGECTFLEKLIKAQAAGASGVVVESDEDVPINPSAGKEEIEAAGETLNAGAVVVLKQSSARVVKGMMDAADAHGFGQVIVAVEPEGHSASTDGQRIPGDDKGDAHRVLYLNGHPLLNTRMVV
ncbi:glycoside hydrolase family 47 protein [Jaapia argillacea MUCL 33604]|uniref:alpha-1,2-Mannosidase n=1 Tax=Jaapia argillacea MUCL 33604 TaxID=933084 RepID=A0A067QFB5_9AGAM|nr:glycoside hydrolase family 47 protein [Jaapia argillacea MUCL 33604]